MSERAPVSTEIALPELLRLGEGWLLDCEYRQHSPRTLEERREILARLEWFLVQQGRQACSETDLRAFLAHVATGHLREPGRWGRHRTPVKPKTVHSYHGRLRTLFGWLARQGYIERSLMERIDPPRVPRVRIEPFTDDHLDALLRAARKGTHPRRDEAILLFLLDTGARASEVCSLKRGDYDMLTRRCVVRGKGGHERALCLGAVSARALWAYLNEEQQDPAAALFLADRGTRAGEGLTRNGLRQLFHRLGERAGLEGVRCSPHTFRHSYAVRFLQAGGNGYQLQDSLGHTHPAMTAKYVHLAAVDVEQAQRQFSPVDRLRRRR